jgi:hypothetical protein
MGRLCAPKRIDAAASSGDDKFGFGPLEGGHTRTASELSTNQPPQSSRCRFSAANSRPEIGETPVLPHRLPESEDGDLDLVQV